MTFTDCEELINAVSTAETVEVLHSICSDVCKKYGFEHFIYGSRFPTSFVKPYFIFISGYPKQWREHYTNKNYMLIDPTVQHCAQHFTPLQWGESTWSSTALPDTKHMMCEARDFGLTSGVSFPIHTPQGDDGMLTFSSEQIMLKSQPIIQRVLPLGQLFTVYLHEAVRRIFNSEVLSLSKVELTQRQKECLLWATEGKTSWETSQILNISERTVIFHLQNVQDKLGVNNRQHAVARAVSLGVIDPQLI